MKLTRQRTQILVLAVLVIMGLVFFNLQDSCKKVDNSVCKLDFGHKKLKVTVAYSEEAQAKGLMGVKELKDGDGMIFVYKESEYLSFWMKNTLIPLSIAFVDANGKIIDIQDMMVEKNKPDYELRRYTSNSPAKYAIETPIGWFLLNGIKKGDKIKLPKELL